MFEFTITVSRFIRTCHLLVLLFRKTPAVVYSAAMKKKTIKIDPEVASGLQDQLEAFKRKFGREAGPNDPVFFDPDADTPQPISIEKLRAEVIQAAKKAGLDPARALRTFGFDEEDALMD